MADILVFRAGFAPDAVAAMPLTRIRYWFQHYQAYAKATQKP